MECLAGLGQSVLVGRNSHMPVSTSYDSRDTEKQEQGENRQAKANSGKV